MSRPAHAAVACPQCRAALALDERLSARAASLVYACKECGRLWSMSPRDRRLVEESALAETGSRTQRMPAIKAPPPGATDRLPEGVSVSLEVTAGPARGKVFPLRRRMVVIGRDEGDVQVADAMISRRHASVEVHDADTIVLRDLSSTNGTYHNDQLIAFCRVQDGDEIRLGSTTLTVSVDLAG